MAYYSFTIIMNFLNKFQEYNFQNIWFVIVGMYKTNIVLFPLSTNINFDFIFYYPE